MQIHTTAYRWLVNCLWTYHCSYTDATETRGVWRQCAVALKRGQSARETLQEAVTLGQLCHPNIVRLFGITLPERPVSVLTAIYCGQCTYNCRTSVCVFTAVFGRRAAG